MPNRREQRVVSRKLGLDAFWSLSVIPLEKPKWLATGAKNPFSSPFFALAVGCLLTGFNKMLAPLLWGLCCCALWLAIDFWPLAKMFSTWFGNRPRFTAPRLRPRLQTSQRNINELQKTREAMQKAWLSISFVSLCVLIILPLGAATAFAVRSKAGADRTDLFLSLQGSPVNISDVTSRQATITLSNQGSQEMTVLSVSCLINNLRTIKDNYISGLVFHHPSSVVLSTGGDGQAIDCPGDPPVFQEKLKCADLTWDVYFTNNADLHYRTNQMLAQRKKFRFVLLNGHTEWRQVANHAAVTDCSKD